MPLGRTKMRDASKKKSFKVLNMAMANKCPGFEI